MKRLILFLVLVFALTSFVMAGATNEAPDADADGGLPFDGQEITLLMHPTLYGTTGGDGGLVAEFEAETDATVEVVTAPIPEHSEKAMLDFISGRGAYDVINMQSGDMTDEFVQYFLPLNDYIDSAPDEWRWEDIIESLAQGGNRDGVQLGIPYRWGQTLMYYRSDLFEAAGLEPPRTYDELLDVARALTTDEVYGYVQRGKAPVEISHDWLTTFYGHGGELILPDGSNGIDSQEAIDAINLWKTLYDEGVFPPDIFAWGRDDYITAMQQGRAAMGGYVGSYYQRFFGDDSTLERDQIGWALMPAQPGVAEGRNRSGGWYLVINKDSEYPDAAWGLVETLTSPEGQLLEAVEHANGPIRESVFASQAYNDTWPQADLMSIATANQVTDPPNGVMPRVHEIIGNAVVAAMRGEKTPEEAVADASAQIGEALRGF